jgi:hypothetical protein
MTVSGDARISRTTVGYLSREEPSGRMARREGGDIVNCGVLLAGKDVCVRLSCESKPEASGGTSRRDVQKQPSRRGWTEMRST